jgi:hypothetical protein
MVYRRSLFHPSHKRKIVRSSAKAHEEQRSTMQQADPQQNGLCGSPLHTGIWMRISTLYRQEGMGTTKGRGLRGGVAPQPRRKEGYLDLDRGGGASGVQVWEGRLLWNESRVGQCLLTSRSGEIACSCLCIHNGCRV